MTARQSASSRSRMLRRRASAWETPVSRPEAQAGVAVDARDARLLERLHGDLPLTDRPFAEVGAELGMGEDEVLERLRRLFTLGVLTRFGPLVQIERAGGRFVLAALEVPEPRFDEVAAIVNALPEVAHNYRRESDLNTPLNMWFVLATETKEGIAEAVHKIEVATGLTVYPFPKLKEYFVEMKLSVRNPA